MSITVTVNGAPRELAEGTTLHELVEQVAGPSTGTSAGPPSGVAVAVDDEVVPRTSWSRPVSEGARVEVLTAVQGG